MSDTYIPVDLAQLRRLRRVRWAVRSALLLGVLASIAANVLHARPDLISQTISAWPPLALLLTVELVSRVPLHRRHLAVLRVVATIVISTIAAWVSYWHMADVASRYGETGASPYLLPVSVDGLIVVASISLVELAGRIRAAEAVPRGRTGVRADGRPDGLADPRADGPATVRADERPAEGPAVPVPAVPVPAVAGTAAAADQRTKPDTVPVAARPSRARTPDPAGPTPDVSALLPAGRAVRDRLGRDGRALTRDALLAGLREDGQSCSTARASALLSALNREPHHAPALPTDADDAA